MIYIKSLKLKKSFNTLYQKDGRSETAYLLKPFDRDSFVLQALQIYFRTSCITNLGYSKPNNLVSYFVPVVNIKSSLLHPTLPPPSFTTSIYKHNTRSVRLKKGYKERLCFSVRIHIPQKLKTVYHTKYIKIPEHHHYFHEKVKEVPHIVYPPHSDNHHKDYGVDNFSQNDEYSRYDRHPRNHRRIRK